MKFDPQLMARLQAATQELLKHGPAASTAALRRAMGGPDDTAPTRPAFKDLNAAPDYARAAPPPEPAASPAPGAGLEDLLARFGSGLPQGFELPTGASLPPGQTGRKRPPPPPLPAGATFAKASFSNLGGTRDYKLYVPSTYRGQAAPLIVMLHGCTQDPDDFAAGTRMNQLAEQHGFLVLYPAQSQQANQSRCWNWFAPGDQQHGRGEPAIIAGMTREVMRRYAVDPRRVAIAGLSAGGAMAVIVGTLYPELFHVVGVHSGLPYGAAQDLPAALQAMKSGRKGQRARTLTSPPLIVFHGDKDHTVHAINGEQLLADALAPHGSGVPARTQGKAPAGRRYTRTVHTAADGRVVAEHWLLHGGGHAWAGGSASGSYTDPKGPDASQELFRFLMESTGAAAVDGRPQP